MGFSISGSAAIIFAGMFISFGIFYGATSNSFELVSDAQSDQTDAVIDEKNTNIEIVVYERPDATDRLTILVNNTGARPLAVSDTDIFVDNEYVADPRTQVDGDGTTDLWAPGEQLNITVRDSASIDRVKVVSEHGVADSVTLGSETRVVF